MSDKLKPCPFCGSDPKVSFFETESLWSHNIVQYTKVCCPECDISFSSEPDYEVEAPDAWNTRHEEHQSALITELVGALKEAKKSIEHLPENALGRTSVDDINTGEPSFDYPIKDELLSNIQDALTKAKEYQK